MTFAPNRLAALLHTKTQSMVITDIRDENGLGSTYTLKSADGSELAQFRPGQYIPVFVNIDGNDIERPYAITSSPKDAEEGFYKITVKKADGGYVSNYINENWENRTAVTIGSPLGNSYYSSIRDSRNVIGIAGGVGITPFHSMAKAIVEGDLDFNLTLFYGVNTSGDALYSDEWRRIEEAADGRFKCILVVANEDVKGAERGFITLDIISKYADINGSSIFVSGPEGMINHVRKMLAPLELPRKYVRYDIGGDSAFVNDKASGCYTLTVHQAGNTCTVEADAKETILRALEKSGLNPPVHCRSGICGYCRSFVVSGDAELAADETGLRSRDKQLGFIHPCCTYPESDMEIIVQRA